MKKGLADVWGIVIIFYIIMLFSYLTVIYIDLGFRSGIELEQQRLLCSNQTYVIVGSNLCGNATMGSSTVNMQSGSIACNGDMISCAFDTVGKVIQLGFLSSDYAFVNLLFFLPMTIIFILALAHYVKEFIPTVGG